MANIDDTWGGQDANCYLSLSDATSFIGTGIVVVAPWTEASTTQRRAALLQATLVIDSRQYVGKRFYYSQRLEFPRTILIADFPWNYTEVGSAVSIAHARMKDDVRRATAFQAMWLLRSGLGAHAQAIAVGVTQKTKRVGPVSETYAYKARPNPLAPEVVACLSQWMTSTRVVRG